MMRRASPATTPRTTSLQAEQGAGGWGDCCHPGGRRLPVATRLLCGFPAAYLRLPAYSVLSALLRQFGPAFFPGSTGRPAPLLARGASPRRHTK